MSSVRFLGFATYDNDTIVLIINALQNGIFAFEPPQKLPAFATPQEGF